MKKVISCTSSCLKVSLKGQSHNFFIYLFIHIIYIINCVMFIFHDNFLINKIIFFNSFDLSIIKHKIKMSGLKKNPLEQNIKKEKLPKKSNLNEIKSQ